MLPEFKHSTQDFYTQLKTELESHGIENVRIKEKNISTGGMLSKQRLYLHVKWKEYHYDCCFAPFGKGTFVSWWLYTEVQGGEKILGKIPFLGKYLVQSFYPITYYRYDTASMFMGYAQSSVLKVIDEITKETGFRVNDNDRKPILKNIFNR